MLYKKYQNCFEAIAVLTVSIFLFVLLKNDSSSDIIVKLTLVTGAIIENSTVIEQDYSCI